MRHQPCPSPTDAARRACISVRFVQMPQGGRGPHGPVTPPCRALTVPGAPGVTGIATFRAEVRA